MQPKQLESRILREINRANREFELIGEGDRILVALSGGKDSYVMLWALQALQAKAVFNFEIVGYHLDQGQPGHDVSPLEKHFESLSIPHEIEYQDTYTRVVEKTEEGKIFCSLCSRFRRAILYKAALRHGCNKVALGHHRDDIIETLLLNLFYSGQIKGMPARLLADNGQLEVIRPLAFVAESHIASLAAHLKFTIMPCNLCGSLESQRQNVKKLLATMEKDNIHLKGNLMSALANVRVSHLLDKNLNPLFHDDVPSTAWTPTKLEKPGDLVQIGG
ncbi:MAG: tRNA 2-thiocytidine(32) synthetase TtcA [Myxococcota bacterium]|nr:tRNA 2-thiocytidine(32) synthetase TtcA [Myxococcota bacterium]